MYPLNSLSQTVIFLMLKSAVSFSCCPKDFFNSCYALLHFEQSIIHHSGHTFYYSLLHNFLRVIFFNNKILDLLRQKKNFKNTNSSGVSRTSADRTSFTNVYSRLFRAFKVFLQKFFIKMFFKISHFLRLGYFTLLADFPDESLSDYYVYC